jgi:hypothetical protein
MWVGVNAGFATESLEKGAKVVLVEWTRFGTSINSQEESSWRFSSLSIGVLDDSAFWLG